MLVNKSKLPKAPEIRVEGLSFDIRPEIMNKWDSGIKAADSDEEENSISILDIIGSSIFFEGVTAKRIAGALRQIGKDNDVVVYINSPGGDMFEGLAIYNLLREHKGKVTVKILGLAASAASFIAMAANEIQIGRAAFYMIHNAWTCACGDRHDFADLAERLEPFDRSIADIYAVRTGDDLEELMALMDKETWIGGSDAVDRGFADSLLSSDEVDHDEESTQNAIRSMDVILAKAGYNRTQRRELFKSFKVAMQDADDDDDDTPSAVFDFGEGESLADAANHLQRIL